MLLPPLLQPEAAPFVIVSDANEPMEYKQLLDTRTGGKLTSTIAAGGEGRPPARTLTWEVYTVVQGDIIIYLKEMVAKLFGPRYALRSPRCFVWRI